MKGFPGTKIKLFHDPKKCNGIRNVLDVCQAQKIFALLPVDISISHQKLCMHRNNNKAKKKGDVVDERIGSLIKGLDGFISNGLNTAQ